VGPEYGDLLEVMAEIRPTITGSGRPFAERRGFWYELVDGPVRDAIRDGDTSGAREMLAKRVEAWIRGGTTVAAVVPAAAPATRGLVSLVGAGPGDPDLLTIKAARRLAEADAVVFDRLIDPRVLGLARPDAALHDAGKQGFGEAVQQDETTQLLVRLGRAGQRVVRLKGGDPFIFGRGGEEASALAEAGIPFEVVPGVTSGIAGPAYAGIPVTDRRFSRSVAFVTGHEADRNGAASSSPGWPGPDWTALAAIDTLVVFMGGRAADGIALRLLEAGRAKSTPVAVIRAATTEQQDITLLDLAELARRGAGMTDDRPVLLVIGDVVSLAPSLTWFQAPPATDLIFEPERDVSPEPASLESRP
jgi:uroporphyrin-III C-methyltransferase